MFKEWKHRPWPLAAGLVLLAASSASSAQLAVLDAPRTDAHPVADGVVAPDEWRDAAVLPDGNGLAGATYAMWRQGLNYDTWRYDGYFTFLLHNIEQNTTYANGATGPAFNVFDIYASAADPYLDLEVVVRYDGFDVTRYSDAGVRLETRSFTAGVDLAPEATSTYDWDRYWGVYALGGFNNSAFAESLPLAVDNDNQVFEVIVRGDALVTARRSLKDPDQFRNWMVVTYNDVIINPVPEPSTWWMFAAGTLLLTGVARQRRR